jgi:hypothetical protein
MVKKIIAWVSVVFFTTLFLACSKKPPPPEYKLVKPVHINIKWTELPEGESFPWEDSDGFFPNEEHFYGFDRHTKPIKKEDSIVYVSVVQKGSILTSLEKKDTIKSKDGFVTLKINQDYGGDQLPVEYHYYICDPTSPYPYKMIEDIDNSKNKQSYKFTDYEEVKKIAICKESEGMVQIIQELHIHTYPWKKYDFLPVYYSNGGSPDEKNALVASYEFWESSRDIYKQALVAPTIKDIIEMKNKKYLYTRMRGTYIVSNPYDINYCSLGGDIFNANFAIQKEVTNRGLPNRAILQLNLPTRRFWSLKRSSSGNDIVICGSPEEMPSYDVDYVIIPLNESNELNDGCDVPNNKYIRRNGSDGKLYLVSYNNTFVPATMKDLNPRCVGMAEPKNYEREYYVGEMSYGLYVETTLINKGPRISLTILPWSGEFTSLVANRELGKAMGLEYMDMDLSGIGDDNPNSEQNNIMLFHLQLGGYKLRQRSVPVMDLSPTGMGYEKQWDCLQRISPQQSCSHQDWLFE